MPSNNPSHDSQPRRGGQFAKDPNKPGKVQVNLRVDRDVAEAYKARHGKGYSSKISKLVEDYMREDNEANVS